MQRTKIEYLTHVWNPIAMRCDRVSAGCLNCWHLRMARRMSMMKWYDNRALAYWGEPPQLIEKELSAPLHLRKPARIGVQFMGDLFHDLIEDELFTDIIRIIMKSPQHVFIMLTKRPDRMRRLFESIPILLLPNTPKGSLNNLWLGISVEDQQTADERIPLLLQTPAAHRFVSYEPALGLVDFKKYFSSYHYECNNCKWMGSEIEESDFDDGAFDVPVCPECGSENVYENKKQDINKGIDWLIMGGESGPGARPMNPEWARSVRDQCKAAGVPFFFKQMSGKQPIPKDLMIKERGV